jgi:hypothetical protein
VTRNEIEAAAREASARFVFEPTAGPSTTGTIRTLAASLFPDAEIGEPTDVRVEGDTLYGTVAVRLPARELVTVEIVKGAVE